MKLLKIAGCIFFVFFKTETSSQTIINGDFENNSYSSCRPVLSNLAYTILMNNSWAFGSDYEISIQDTTCSLFSVPSNTYFISLTKNQILDFGAISLEISSPLTMGDLYELSYYEHTTDTFIKSIVPLYIGLSLDSISFGTFLHSSTPNLNTWTKRIFRFVAPNNGKYLTVSMPDVGELPGWNSVDKFEISNVTGIKEVDTFKTKVYPNPAQEQVTIESDFQMQQAVVYDLLGKKVLAMDFQRTNTIQLNVSNLIPGYYLLNLLGDDGIRKVVKLCVAKAAK